MIGALAGFGGACGGRPAPLEGPVSRDVETDALRATAPDAPLRIVFDWAARERDARFTGRGVARVGPQYRARLDLFGPRGEGVLTAALLRDQLRLPSRAGEVTVPPVPLLWSVLGVFRPPEGAELTGTERQDSSLVLEYADPPGRWRFTIEGGRVARAEWNHPERGRQTVVVEEVGDRGVPGRSVYRDYAAVRELALTLDRVDEVEPFPDEIWTPGAR